MSMIIRPYPGFILPTPRFVDVEVSVSPVQTKGRFKIIKRDAWGGYKSETPWFDNLVLDSGLNRWGSSFVISGAAIGTGTSTPDVAQTGLDTQVHWTTTAGTGSGTTVLGSSPYNNTRTHVYRTTLGALNGNYSEVSAGWASGSNMFSRALILDGGGSPTTYPVSSTEQLDIAYQVSVFPPLADTSTSVTISGVSYTVTGRAAYVNNNSSFWGVATYAEIRGIGSGQNTVFNGPIGAITAGPTGSGATSNPGHSNAAYSGGSYTRQCTMTHSLTDGNVAGGVKSTMMSWGGFGAFQYEFSSSIPKDGTKTLALNYSVSWSRRP